jgi:hypothetical protein
MAVFLKVVDHTLSYFSDSIGGNLFEKSNENIFWNENMFSLQEVT